MKSHCAVTQTLIDARVLSVPVYSRAHRRYEGLLDMLDFVSYINKHFKRDEVDQVVDMTARFSSVKVVQVSNVSERNPWYPVDGNAPLRKVSTVTVCVALCVALTRLCLIVAVGHSVPLEHPSRADPGK